MNTRTEDLADLLRRRVLAALHRGSRAPGDRLPGIRRMARELGRDHRAVAGAYRRLEHEGLVEIRPRSGVYVARTEPSGGEGVGRFPGGQAWLGEILYGGWQRGLTPPELVRVLERALPPRPISAACLETVRDPLDALASEVETVLAVGCRRVLLPLGAAPWNPVVRSLVRRPPGFVVTTAYHMGVRAPLEDAGIPVVLLRINPEWVAALRAWASRPGLVVVVADPDAVDRFRMLLGTDLPVDYIALDGVDGVARPRPPRRALVYASVLARRSLPPHWAERVEVPDVSLLAPGTVRDLMDMLVRATLQPAGGDSEGRRDGAATGESVS